MVRTMSVSKFGDINYNQMETLKELGNIGAGNAATALSAMLGKRVALDVPKTELATFDRAINMLGDPCRMTAGIMVRLGGGLDGMLMHLFEQPFAEAVISGISGRSGIDLAALDEDSVSLLSEVGNIMSGSYVTAIADFLGMKVDISVPALAVDMLGAIMSVPAVELAQVSDTVLLIKEDFTIGNAKVNSQLLFIPSAGTLDGLLKKLGAMI